MEKEGGGERKREAERETGREIAKSITQLVIGRALDPNAIISSEVNVDSTYRPSL